MDKRILPVLFIFFSFSILHAKNFLVTDYSSFTLDADGGINTFWSVGTMPEAALDFSHTPDGEGACMKVGYHTRSGIVINFPNIDLSYYRGFSFLIRGENGTEILEELKLKGNNSKEAPPAGNMISSKSFLPNGITANWQKVTVPFEAVSDYIDPPYDKAAAILLNNQSMNSKNIYIDDIVFLHDVSPITINTFDSVGKDDIPNYINGFAKNYGWWWGAVSTTTTNGYLGYCEQAAFSGSGGWMSRLNFYQNAGANNPGGEITGGDQSQMAVTFYVRGHSFNQLYLVLRTFTNTSLSNLNAPGIEYKINICSNAAVYIAGGHTIDSSWKKVSVPLSDLKWFDNLEGPEPTTRFTNMNLIGLNIEDGETGALYIDQLMIEDIVPPSAPTALYCNGIPFTNSFTFSSSQNELSVQIPDDPTLYCVRFQYSTNNANWHTIANDFDVNTTGWNRALWNMSLSNTNCQVRAVVEDKSGNQAIIKRTNCRYHPVAFSSSSPALIPSCAWKQAMGATLSGAPHPFDTFASPYSFDEGYLNGVPIGGFGAGSIGRNYNGAFRRWHLNVGEHWHEVIAPDQFSVFQMITNTPNSKIAQVLYAGSPEGDSASALSSWNWNLPQGAGTYYALFPKAWYDYSYIRFPAKLTCVQFSPVIPETTDPKGLETASYPVGVYKWIAQNPGTQSVEVSIMFTFENMSGWVMNGINNIYPQYPAVQALDKTSSGNSNYYRTNGNYSAVVLSTKNVVNDEQYGEYCIAVKKTNGVSISYQGTFDCGGDGSDIWTRFSTNGTLDNSDARTVAGSGQRTGGAICAKFTLLPGETKEIPFTLSWDLPIMKFPGSSTTYWFKQYTKYFGESGKNSFAIATNALKHYPDWESKIDQWQNSYIQDSSKPTWYYTMLFNELYSLLDGGTAWEAKFHPSLNAGNQPPYNQSPSPGHANDYWLSFLESYTYPNYSTSDVDFYSSWALFRNWPSLEKKMITEVKDVIRGDAYTLSNSGPSINGNVPHDLGGPSGSPWFTYNIYTFRDTTTWKDMNCKFVIRAYRDYILDTGHSVFDTVFLQNMWLTCTNLLGLLSTRPWDTNSTLPINTGWDQTYDDLKMYGTSSYCGGLWLTALESVIEMAKTLAYTNAKNRYANWLDRAKPAFTAKLWNNSGGYFNLDTDSTLLKQGYESYNDTFSDALCGQWWAYSLGLPLIVDRSKLNSHLTKIYNNNVANPNFYGIGAMNAVRPDGQLDTAHGQSQEVWTGTTFGLASLMIHNNMKSMGELAAWGIYNRIYQTKGLWFRTPEAWHADGNFRASIYQRPQSIWAMTYAYENIYPDTTKYESSVTNKTADLNSAIAGPNPAKNVQQVVFDKLPVQCTIEIYTISGSKVITLSKNDNAYKLIWNLRNQSGKMVASGIYICRLTTFSEHQKIIRLGVIR